MRYAALGVAFFVLGLAGMLVYVNHFSEHEYAHGRLVLELAWASLIAGLTLTLLGAARVVFRRHA